MSGETSLKVLLSNLKPKRHNTPFVFTSISQASEIDWRNLSPFAMFQEKEGVSLILPLDVARSRQFDFENIFSCITLEVHSSLNAVGLTAVVSHALASRNIPTNIVAAFHHDHLFVPVERADEAIQTLKEISKSS